MILLIYISTLRHTYKQASNQDFAKEGGLEVKFFLFEKCLDCVASQGVLSIISYRRESEGEAPAAVPFFLTFREKITISTPLGSHFARF